ncbi:hypothetical protein FRB94_008784 [Tulasnella sp. JGI-2019a]|nr:hypothetical protein FRB94_008784 [Tulasnella sp. JGI-2019a]
MRCIPSPSHECTLADQRVDLDKAWRSAIPLPCNRVLSEHLVSTTKKRALLIGVRYRGLKWRGSDVPMDLHGTHNDVECWKYALMECGYLEKDIRILWDRDDVHPLSNDYPNRKNILREMRALTAGVQDYQRRFLAFCGHRQGVAPDGSDSAILGADTQNPISDADLKICLLDPLTKLSSLTVSGESH